MPDLETDLLILGAGSTAFAAALRAAEFGKRSVMIESRTVGGTCANRGCLPSKNLIEAARWLHDARQPRYPGLAALKPRFDMDALIRQKDEVIAGYVAKKYSSAAAAHAEIRLLDGRARFIDAHSVAVEGSEGRRVIASQRILIALGSAPIIPEISGLDEVGYLTSDLLTSGEAVEMTDLPRSLIVLGGGYIALELGQMFARLGVDVTVIERGPFPLRHGYEPEVGPAIKALLAAEGVRFVTRAEVIGVRSDTGHRTKSGARESVVVTVRAREATQDLRAERLLVATGRRPQTDGVGLDEADVRMDADGAVVVDEWLRTSAAGIWAAGDVIGSSQASQMATPVGARDGGLAAHNAFAEELGLEPRAVNHRVIPRAIFTDPQIALVGLTERQVIATGRRCWCNTLPIDIVPRAGATHDTRGIVKMVADADTNEVLGVTLICANAAEVIHEAAMGLRFHATLDDFIDLLHVYPTMSEALKLVAISRYKDPGALSCCAD
ncbi:MAG TPA: mercury(II) reductase [Ktedonobacterales bacterium]